MRPQGVRPKYGGQGIQRPNSFYQNGPRPQCSRPPSSKSPRLSRGNGNANRNGKMFGPYGLMVGPTRPSTGPNGVLMMGPSMNLSGPASGPNVPTMGPTRHMMMPNRPMVRPNVPMGSPGFMDPSNCNSMRPAFGIPPPPSTRPPILPNSSNGNGPPQLTSNADSVHSGSGDQNDENASGQSNVPSNNSNFHYNYSQFGASGMNCGWSGNAFPAPWNFSSPPNQVYHQNSNENMEYQFSNQDYSQSYYYNHNHSHSQEYSENHDQYYNHRQSYTPNHYYNVKQEGAKPNFNHNGPKNKKKNEKFQKMRSHYCDTCDRSLPSEEALATHISEHKVCGLDECKFTAHPKVVEKHQQMQHYSGLYRRIGSLYTPEDIDKWRKDRKKNYPTTQNVEERRAKQEEMYARGERMGAPNNRGPRPHPQRNGRFQQRPNNRPNHQNNNGNSPDFQKAPSDQPAQPPRKWKPVFPSVALVIEENEERSGVKPFPGTAALLPKTLNPSAKDDTPKPVKEVSIPRALNGSLSFLSQYGNSSSEDDSDTEEALNDSTLSERPAEENCLGEPEIVKTNPSHIQRNADQLQPKAEASDKSLTIAVLQPTSSSGDTIHGEEKIKNECTSMDTNEVPVPSQLDTETEDGEIQDSSSGNVAVPEVARSLEPVKPSSEVSIPRQLPTFPSKESTMETESKIASADSFQKDSTFEIKVLSQETGPFILEEPESVPFTADKTVSVLQANKEMNGLKNGHDASDDSGPEEVPTVKDGADKVGGGDDEENDEVVSGGRKRRRQSRQPNKKYKADEKQTSQQQEPHNRQTNQNQEPNNKNAQRREDRVVRKPHPPVRRAPPTLLEKLLSKEICHERNVILQCVRYVVENRFFRIERK